MCPHRLLVIGLLSTFLVLGTLQAQETAPKEGLLPGPLHVLNVTGPAAGRFHCPVTEADLGPGVVVFIRAAGEQNQVVGKLLQGIEGWTEQHPSIQAAAIFLDDGGYRSEIVNKSTDKGKVADLALTKSILAKDERAAQLTGLAQNAKLKRVVLCLGNEEVAKEYHLGADAVVTVIGYYEHRPIAKKSFTKETLMDAAIEPTLKELQAALDKVWKPAPARR